MLPTTDLLPLDFSLSSTQTVDNKANLSPSSDLEATFSDLMREPLVSDQTALVDIVGEELPPSGSQLPVESMPEQIDLFAEADLEIISDLPPHLSLDSKPMPVPVALPSDSDALPIEDNTRLALGVVNPAPPVVPADEQSRSIDFRQQRSAIDPFARQPLSVENAPERTRNGSDEIKILDRQQPIREFPQVTHPQLQRAPIDVGPGVTEKITSELPANIAVSSKVEGGELAQKINLPVNSIAVNSASIDTSQIRQPSPASTTPVSTIATTIDVPVMNKAWGNALQDRVMWMTGRGIQNAEIRLNPAELGPIRVQVIVENDAAQLTFNAQHAVTRDAIEQAMPRLREMLSENGLSLSGSTVSDGDNSDVNKDQNALDRVAHDDAEPTQEEGLDVSASSIREPNPAALIDTFA